MNSLITANGVASVTVNSGSGSLTTMATGSNGDTIEIFPCWTLAGLFTNCAIPSLPNGTQVLTFDGAVGIKNSASAMYTYYSGNGWYNGNVPADDVVINPGDCLVIRNVSAAPFPAEVRGRINRVETLP